MKNPERDLVRLKHIENAILLIEEFSSNIDARCCVSVFLQKFFFGSIFFKK